MLVLQTVAKHGNLNAKERVKATLANSCPSFPKYKIDQDCIRDDMQFRVTELGCVHSSFSLAIRDVVSCLPIMVCKRPVWSVFTQFGHYVVTPKLDNAELCELRLTPWETAVPWQPKTSQERPSFNNYKDQDSGLPFVEQYGKTW